eukprot:14974695-Alexandrium_andersonii.AAC.1
MSLVVPYPLAWGHPEPSCWAFDAAEGGEVAQDAEVLSANRGGHQHASEHLHEFVARYFRTLSGIWLGLSLAVTRVATIALPHSLGRNLP